MKSDLTERLESPFLIHRYQSRSASVEIVVATIASVGFLISWVLPYRTYPFASFYNDYVGLLAIVISLLVVYYHESRPIALVPASVGLPIGLAILIVVDASTGRMWAPREALIPIGYLVLAAGAILLGRNLTGSGSHGESNRDRVFDIFCAALLLAGILSAFLTFFQYLGVDDLLGDWSLAIGHGGVTAIRPYANLGQPNQLALILCWSLAALWRLFARNLSTGIVSLLLGTVLLASLALTQSKVAWFVVPGLACMVVFANRRLHTRKVPVIALIGLVSLLVVFTLMLPWLSHLLGTTTEDVAKRMETNGVRSVMILQGLYIGLQHPLAGVGWSGFGAGQIEVAPLFADTQYAMHAHNFVANLAAESGWVVTIAVVSMIAVWFFRRYVKRAITINTLFALMVFASVGFHSLVEFPLWYAYVLMPVALLVGLADNELDITGLVRMKRLHVVVASLLVALLMMCVAIDYRKVVQSFRALGLHRVGLEYADGSTAEPDWTIFPHFYRYIAFADLQPTVRMTQESIDNAERIARRFGYAPVLMRLATIYALNERPDAAVRVVTSMQHLYPQRYPETYEAWRVMGDEYPAVLGPVFRRLPPPAVPK